LSGVYVALVIYASLYPFEGWRDQGLSPLSFVVAHWPKYWTAFDLYSNVLGYLPLGFFLALGILRTDALRGERGIGRNAAWAVGSATLAGGLLSLAMETLQSYLPMRVPSNVDWALNTAGTWGGAMLAASLERRGWLARWSRFRARWFVPEARGALVLLALWPFALLAPSAVPLGLGQVYDQIEPALREVLQDSTWLAWLPPHATAPESFSPVSELACVFLGALIPCLLGYCIINAAPRRMAFALGMMAVALGASLLAAVLTYSPSHAWAWLSRPVQVGMALATAVALLLARVPLRVAAALLLVLLGVFLSLVNQAPTSPYFAHNLQIWEQGRFIYFNGTTRWLAWFWPYALLAYVIARFWRERHVSAHHVS
jgi:VanZ family protein